MQSGQMQIHLIGKSDSRSEYCVQVTTARKATTLLLSYIIFTKPLLGQHCTGLLLIGMGITLKMLPDHCQQRIRGAPAHRYSALQSEASTSRSDPSDPITKLEQGEKSIVYFSSNKQIARVVENLLF